MLKIESREAANLKSRVKDLSQVPNLVNYAGLFACITPLSKAAPNDDGVYEPVLVRDTNSLIQHFGDPRIDPERYVDLYSIMQIVGDGTSCYVAKVSSGTPGIYKINLYKEMLNGSWTISNDLKECTYNVGFTHPVELVSAKKTTGTQEPTVTDLVVSNGQDLVGNQCSYTCNFDETTEKYILVIKLGTALTAETGALTNVFINHAYYALNAYSAFIGSSASGDITIKSEITQVKPLSLAAYYLKISVIDNGNELSVAKIKLDDALTNQDLVNALTSLLNPYVQFDLVDSTHANACASNDEREYSIVKAVLDLYAPIDPQTNQRATIDNDIELLDSQGPHEGGKPEFKVTIDDYTNALNQYKDRKYAGCLMADLVAPLTHRATTKDYNSSNTDEQEIANQHLKITFGVPTPDERRTLHYWIKQVACERKDVNVILSVPLIKNDSEQEQLDRYDGTTKFSLDEVCQWVASLGTYSKLWEYGHTDTTDYAEQSFYLEMYFTWLSMNCVKLEDGIAKSAVVQVAPANVVAQNVLRSYRERGPHLPVAGDQYGALPSSYSVIVNPKTKAQRDQLVQYRINPIYDTGTRGVQIYGNETLNAGYTDLNAAHIARELVNIRSRIDEYTETLKFMLNNAVLWDTWKAYVSTNILDPAKSINAIKSYAVAMGYDTTTPEEMANRMVKGQVSLQFYQSAEIFDLTFTIFSTSAETLG